MRLTLNCFLLMFPLWASGKIMLPAILTDHMVLQQEQTVKIWGWTSKSSETIRVQPSWNKEIISTKAIRGYWEVEVRTPSYGGPYTIDIQGHEKITIHDVLIGEVWLASGQSNMEMTVDSTTRGFPGMMDYPREISAADYPKIRLFLVPRRMSLTPQDDLVAQWEHCQPETVKEFSAVAYVFAEQLHKKLRIPVGIISSSWGGTNAETWVRKEYMEADRDLARFSQEVTEGDARPNRPGSAFNAMIHPLLNFTIKGALWYQGESNRANADQYHQVMEVLIKNWREEWGYNFPFYFVQIAPYDYKSGTPGAYIREAQLNTLAVSKTGRVVTNDIGKLTKIHRRKKREVGERLALWALARDYGQTDLVYSGPLFRSMEVKGAKAILDFDHAEGGLIKRGVALTGFEIAGQDRIFHPAEASISGQRVVVKSDKVSQPVAVRLAFDDQVVHNLFNAAGLPASPFRTDNWEQ